MTSITSRQSISLSAEEAAKEWAANPTRARNGIGGGGRIILTKEVARASGWDAGNRAMRAGGRECWNDADREVATHETLRLMVAGGHMTQAMAQGCGYAAPA